MSQKILVVDDDLEILEMLYDALNDEGYLVYKASNSFEARSQLKVNPDLMILDVMMPGQDGFEFCKEIRSVVSCPIIFLTAKVSESDLIQGFAIGGDDYLTKPFSISELMARVNSLVRRYTTLNQQESHNQDKIVLKGMSINKSNREVIVQNNQIELTGIVFDLLLFLAMNKGKVYTKRQIYLQVWSDEYAFDDSNIMSFVSKLRKKIEPDPEHHFYIQTVRGVGYRFNSEV